MATENYYLPDFIIKIQGNDGNRYLIIDTKYSTQTTVKKYYFQNLVFKYLFSLSAVNISDRIMGLCAINGKPNNDASKLLSVYSENTPSHHRPYADILTLTADGNDLDEKSHWELLSKLLEKYIV